MNAEVITKAIKALALGAGIFGVNVDPELMQTAINVVSGIFVLAYAAESWMKKRNNS